MLSAAVVKELEPSDFYRPVGKLSAPKTFKLQRNIDEKLF
jgi:hypothetical protein